MLFEHSLCLMHSVKTNLTNRGFLKANSHFWISQRRHLEMWRVMVAVPGLLLSNTMLDNERGPGTATIHVTFQDGGAGKFKSEKSPSENPDFSTYKTKDSFYCYAAHLIYVQRAFWAQLVETAENPFKSLFTSNFTLNTYSFEKLYKEFQTVYYLPLAQNTSMLYQLFIVSLFFSVECFRPIPLWGFNVKGGTVTVAAFYKSAVSFQLLPLYLLLGSSANTTATSTATSFETKELFIQNKENE